jgi:hypothetical protein
MQHLALHIRARKYRKITVLPIGTLPAHISNLFMYSHSNSLVHSVNYLSVLEDEVTKKGSKKFTSQGHTTATQDRRNVPNTI